MENRNYFDIDFSGMLRKLSSSALKIDVQIEIKDVSWEILTLFSGYCFPYIGNSYNVEHM